MRSLSLFVFALLCSSCIIVTDNPRCNDKVRNGSETDVDCGGICGPCSVGKRCDIDPDCASVKCTGGFCAAPSCNDGVQNGDETGVDCGGSCPRCVYQGGAIPNTNVVPVYRILPGASTSSLAPAQAGYRITANFGASYRLIWVGEAGRYTRFWGSVWTPGAFTNVVPGCNGGFCALQVSDFLSQPIPVSGGQRIDFDSVAPGSATGFDFVVSSEPALFDLYIEGAHYTNLVFFPATANGGTVSNVNAFPFGLTTQ